MRKLLVLFGLTVVSAPLWAQIGSSSLTWTNPVTYTDGSPMGLAFIYVERSTISPVGPYTRIANLGPAMLALQSYVDGNLWNATYCYQVIAQDDVYGNESAPSNSACKTIAQGGTNDPPVPGPPTNLTVQ